MRMKIPHFGTLIVALAVIIASDGPLAAENVTPAEIEFWQSVKDSGDRSELEAYLEAYPGGVFAPIARLRLKRLDGSGAGPPLPHVPANAAKPQTTTAPVEPAPVKPNPAPPVTARAPEPNIPPAPPARAVGFLGANTLPLTPKRAQQLNIPQARGAEIYQVVDESPAAIAGLQDKDVIVKLGGMKIGGTDELLRTVRAMVPGTKVDLEVFRNGKSQIIAAVIGDEFQIHWRLAQTGNARSMWIVGNAFKRGDIVKRDMTQAAHWYRKGADAGDVLAADDLGVLYRVGAGVPQDYAKALSYTQIAAEKNLPSALYSVGLHHLNGWGVTKDTRLAIIWLKRAADNGFSSADYTLGHTYYWADEPVRDRALGLTHLRKAATSGIYQAEAVIGHAYEYGNGVAKDYGAARTHYATGAKAGDPYAQFALGQLHFFGKGVPKSRSTAISWYRKAAAQEWPIAVDVLRKLNVPLHDPLELQTLLKRAGFDPGPLDGRPGKQTRAAVEAYQRTRGLPVTGDGSPALIADLRKATAHGTGKPVAPIAPPSAEAVSSANGTDKAVNLDGLDDLNLLNVD